MVDPPEVAPPVVRILSPRNGAMVDPDEVLTLNGDAEDPEDAGSLEYQWSVTYSGNGGPVTLDIGSGNGLQWAPSDTIPGLDCEVNMTAQLNLAVTSASGATGSDYVGLWILLIC